ncbi:MAG: putative glycoside hydrolase [Colwellia sp.]
MSKIKIKLKTLIQQAIKFAIPLFCLLSLSVQAQQANPRYTFFSKGETPSSWQWVLSDPENWWLPLEKNSGSSKSGKITMTSSDDKSFAGAVKLVWNKSPVYGAATITGMTTNLAAFEQKAELVLAVKLEKRGGYITLKMNCGENCEGSVNITDHLARAKLNTWFALPIPLDCFGANGVDFSKITQPFSIGTDSNMTLHIAEINVAAMKGDDQGCVPDLPVAENK